MYFKPSEAQSLHKANEETFKMKISSNIMNVLVVYNNDHDDRVRWSNRQSTDLVRGRWWVRIHDKSQTNDLQK